MYTEIHYPIGDNKQSINKNKNIKLSNTDKFINKVLTIPCYIGLKKKELKKIIKLINNF